MDEVDGMSGGDRGGVGALNVLIKKTKVSGTYVSCRNQQLIACQLRTDSYHPSMQ